MPQRAGLHQLVEDLNPDPRYLQLVQEVINDIEAVQMCGEEDVRETWPDLWETYELACAIIGRTPRIEPDENHSHRV